MTEAEAERMGQHLSRGGACEGLKEEWGSIASRPEFQIHPLGKSFNFIELQFFSFLLV